MYIYNDSSIDENSGTAALLPLTLKAPNNVKVIEAQSVERNR